MQFMNIQGVTSSWGYTDQTVDIPQCLRQRKDNVMPAKLQRITNCLWFDDQAEAAVNLYTSVFPDSRITQVTRYSKEGAKASGRTEGSVMTVAFELDGQEFLALNAGPVFKFNEAVSLVV
jgi:predicted 3-demethylubiquinone-9 3-methyltransferase (glyoxalase superfamily)